MAGHDDAPGSLVDYLPDTGNDGFEAHDHRGRSRGECPLLSNADDYPLRVRRDVDQTLRDLLGEGPAQRSRVSLRLHVDRYFDDLERLERIGRIGRLARIVAVFLLGIILGLSLLGLAFTLVGRAAVTDLEVAL